MKIAHITQYFHPEMGYQENNLSTIEKQNGHEVRIFCINNLKKWGVGDSLEITKLDNRFISKYGISIVRLDYYLSLSSRYFQSGLKKALNSFQPDLLFIHGVSLPMTFSAMKWGAINNKKLIVDDHMVKAGSKNKFSNLFYYFYKPFFSFFLKLNNIKVSKWVAVSDETKKFMQVNYGIEENIDVIPLGYNDKTVFYDKKGSELWMKRNGLDTQFKYILYIGKIDFRKNPGFLLEPFKSFAKVHSNYKLLFVGNTNNDYWQFLNQKIDKLDLKDSVCFVDAVPNNEIRYVFSSVEMAIWPFGSSMAMIEAMACMCPVIASDMQVNQERLSSNRGALYKPGDIQDLIKKMEFVLKNRNEITKEAYKWVINYSWINIEKQIELNNF